MSYKDILFIDIETVSQYETYHHLPGDWKELWDHKAKFLSRSPETESPEQLYQRAGIYAEFGKIICISCGCIQGAGDNKRLKIKSFYGDDETIILRDFADMLEKWISSEKKGAFEKSTRCICAHNGKEFDFPYLCRRLIINSMSLPDCLNIRGKKPWEITHIDTLDLWKFGDTKNYTSLKLLAHVLNIPSPKDDMDGSLVNNVYWVEKDLDRIVRYCQKDVLTLANVYLRMHCEEIVQSENVEYTTWPIESIMHPALNGKIS
ncbi:MAG: ribonuclease H-like domain-containing protein [Flavisolibacter sp.]|nr:ribonuclease H-like domain-containing protein [Flavisolibacter sp.]